MAQFAYLLGRLIYFYEMLIVLWSVMSWFRAAPGTLVDDCYQVLGRICDPCVGLFRRFVPPVAGMDFSPLVAIVVLSFVKRGLFSILL